MQGANGNGGKKTDLLQLNEAYKNKFWIMKQKHSTDLGGGMTGYLNNSVKFMKKVLSEATSNTATLLTETELEEKAKTVFSDSLTSVSSLTEINTAEVLQPEKNLLLQKRIIGKNDVDIAAMILKLNNSDWVRQGLSFYDANDGVCPFCQQTTSESFRKSLSEYFDETFTQDSNALKYSYEYAITVKRVFRIKFVMHNSSRFENLLNVTDLTKLYTAEIYQDIDFTSTSDTLFMLSFILSKHDNSLSNDILLKGISNGILRMNDRKDTIGDYKLLDSLEILLKNNWISSDVLIDCLTRILKIAEVMNSYHIENDTHGIVMKIIERI